MLASCGVRFTPPFILLQLIRSVLILCWQMRKYIMASSWVMLRAPALTALVKVRCRFVWLLINSSMCVWQGFGGVSCLLAKKVPQLKPLAPGLLPNVAGFWGVSAESSVGTVSMFSN